MSIPDEPKRVLVTGATGLIGFHCLAPLLQRGYEVHAVSAKHRLNHESSIVWHQADIFEHASRTYLLESIRPTHLLHLAWYVVPGKSLVSELNFEWVASSMALLQLFQQQGGRRVVMVGSAEEYDLRYGYCHETRTPTNPKTVYGSCKHAFAIMFRSFCGIHGLSHAWARIFYLYGPYENPNRLVASVIRSLLLGQEAKCSHGEQVRDYLYAQDVADALVSVFDNTIQGAVNIGSGRAVSLRNIAMTIGKMLKREDLVKLGAVPRRANEVPFVVADVERLTKEIAWQPRFSLEEGLDQTIKWWRQALAQRI